MDRKSLGWAEPGRKGENWMVFRLTVLPERGLNHPNSLFSEDLVTFSLSSFWSQRLGGSWTKTGTQTEALGEPCWGTRTCRQQQEYQEWIPSPVSLPLALLIKDLVALWLFPGEERGELPCSSDPGAVAAVALALLPEAAVPFPDAWWLWADLC